jgi:glutathione S-transferase
VPILWDGEIVVWDSLAIVEFLADRYGPALYWPEDEEARAVARSMSAEMHSGFSNVRRELPMNVRKSFPPKELSEPVREEIDRILQLWAQARARFGGMGDYLFGDWCAADIMYAPVVTRFVTYGVAVPSFAGVYMKHVLSHPHVAEWIDKAQDEPWVIESVEKAAA